MKKKYIILGTLIALFATVEANAQQGFGTSNPAPSSVIDAVATDKGVLLPRIALTSTIVATPVTAPANALTVFNTATAGTAPNDVTPGYYYWNQDTVTPANSKWVRLLTSENNTDWHLTGNAGTTAGTNFLGTTDANALMFKVNGQQSGYISDNATNTVGATGLYKTTLGYQAGMGTTGDRVTAIGNHALSQNTAQNNTAIGAFALQKNVTGQNNMAVGDNTLVENTGRRNAAIGSNALNSNTTGEGNTAIGYRANASNVAGSFNTFIGSQSGEGVLATGAVTDANSSIAIGRGTTMGAGLTNAMVIGAYGSVTQSNSMVLGALPGTYGGVTVGATKVGIGTTAPSNTLHIVATANPARLEGLQAGAATDAVVTADATGVLKTVATSTLAIEPWQVQGGTAKATANGDNIYQMGSVSIGSSAVIPTFSSSGSTITPKFHVAGDVSTTGAFYTATGVYADYVFEDYFEGSSKLKEDYSFKTLAEVEKFINQNRHLPGIAKIDNLTKNENGDYIINTTELSVQLLEKVEELYLHTIEQQNLIEKQQTEIQDMKTRLERLESLLLEKK